MARFLVLGAGALHIKHYQILRSMGIYIIGMDKNPKAPARKEADVFLASDPGVCENVLKAAQDQSVEAIMPLSEFGVVPAAAAAKHMGLNNHLKLEAARNAHNKSLMKSTWAKERIAQPNFYTVSSLEQARTAAEELGFPFIMKPIELSGSHGVKRINNNHDLTRFFEATSKLSNGQVLVEEYIHGIETSVEGAVINGEAIVFAYADKQLRPHPNNCVTSSINYPGDFNQDQIKNIKKCAQKALIALGLNNSPFHLEVFVTEDQVVPIECAARGGGGHIYSNIVELVSGVNLVEVTARLLLGDSLDVTPSINLGGACYRFLFAPEGKLLSISGLNEIRQNIQIVDVVIAVKPGDVIKEPTRGPERSGFLVSKGRTRLDALQIADWAEQILRWKVR
jgi:biotin carboxylase